MRLEETLSYIRKQMKDKEFVALKVEQGLLHDDGERDWIVTTVKERGWSDV